MQQQCESGKDERFVDNGHKIIHVDLPYYLDRTILPAKCFLSFSLHDPVPRVPSPLPMPSPRIVSTSRTPIAANSHRNFGSQQFRPNRPHSHLQNIHRVNDNEFRVFAFSLPVNWSWSILSSAFLRIAPSGLRIFWSSSYSASFIASVSCRDILGGANSMWNWLKKIQEKSWKRERQNFRGLLWQFGHVRHSLILCC